MTDTNRKAVITTSQVQGAVNRYETVRETITGVPAEGLLFDKGNRGKGFALYNSKDVAVETFDTKEDAYVKFTNWVATATEVLTLQQTRLVETDKTAKKAPAKAAEKPAA